jgi:phenylacetic acid degradation operon negative regulatory protein
VAGERDPKRLAAHLWPVEQLADRYAAFVERYAGVPERLREMRLQRQKLPDAAFLPGALAVAVAYLDCFHDDPLLPPELLPRPWPGRAARDLVAASRRLALGVRQTPGRPALFRLFDDALSAVA